MNVYVEGDVLRKRFGISLLNSASAGTRGNGFYNWVVNASQQYLMGLFDSTLKQMSLSGNTWSGTWVTVSADSANGTAFSNSIMHFVTYQGTIIMTTESRDKPQRITSTDTSFKNIDFNGTGTAPFGKYCQVWKEHVWILNIGNAGQLTEDCASLSSWTTLDVLAGVSSTTTFGGQQTFRYHAGAAVGSDAHIRRTVTGMTTAYSAEIKTYFATMGAVTSNDYAFMDICNGTIRFRTRWSTDGIEAFDGAAWKKIGVGLVSTGVWTTWKFFITAGTATAATIDVFKDTSVAGLQFSVANASTASSGQIDLQANAGGSANRMDWYMDYLYLAATTSRVNYYSDGVFNSWVSTSQASYTDNVLPSKPYLQYKCNDNAGTATVIDTGTGGNNGSAYANTSTLTSTGKIGSAFNISSAAAVGQNPLNMNSGFSTAINADTTGSMTFWYKPVITSGVFWSVSQQTANNYLLFSLSTGATLRLLVQDTTGTVILDGVGSTTLTVGSWHHIALIQSGTLAMYVNNSIQTITYGTSVTPGAWVNNIPTIDRVILGAANTSGGGNTGYISGVLDDVRYYRTALTSSDIQALYGEGNGTEGNPVTVQEGTTFYMGTYSYRVNNDGQYAVVSQTLTSSANIAGTALYFGLWFNATNNSTYKLRINDGTSNYDSATLTANGTWQYQTISFTPMSGATAIRAQVVLLSSCTAYIDQAAIVASAGGATQDYSDRLQRSVSGTYDTWTGSDSGTNDITTAGDVGLTGSFILQDRMYIAKSWNMYRVTYTGSVPLLDIKQIKSVVGTKSPRSIKNIDFPDKGEVVIFLGSDRNLYIFDGFSSTPISDIVQLNNGITSIYTNNINTQALDKVFAINHSDLGWYEIFLPIGDATVPNYSLVFNYRNKAFWPFDNRNFTCGGVADAGDGQRVTFVSGATNGTTYLLNSGTSDAGTAINSYWTSFKLGQDYLLSKIDEFSIITDSVNCTPNFGWRCNFESAYTTKVLKANTNKHNFTPERVDNLIQFKVSDNSTSPSFKIWHIKTLERALGIGT